MDHQHPDFSDWTIFTSFTVAYQVIAWTGGETALATGLTLFTDLNPEEASRLAREGSKKNREHFHCSSALIFCCLQALFLCVSTRFLQVAPFLPSFGFACSYMMKVGLAYVIYRDIFEGRGINHPVRAKQPVVA